MSLSLEPRQTWTEVFSVVKDVFREGGAVAFACSALLLLLYRLLPRVRRTPGWLILRAAHSRIDWRLRNGLRALRNAPR